MAAKGGKSPILIIVILLAVAGVGYYFWKKKKDAAATKEVPEKELPTTVSKPAVKSVLTALKPVKSGFGKTLPGKAFGNISLVKKPFSGGLKKTMTNTKLAGTTMAGG